MRALLVPLVLVSATAQADEVGVVVTGEAVLQPQVNAAIETWLRDHGRAVAGSPLLPDATNQLIDCFVIEDAACARAVVEQSTAPAIVFARVDVTESARGARDFALAATWLAKGQDPVTRRRSCHHCTEEGMRETLVTLLGPLAPEPPPAPAPAPAAPPALVAARAPARVPVSVEARPANVVPLATMGAGGAVLVTGLVLLAVDQSPDPHGAQPPTLRDTATAGVVFSLLGAAAVGAGGYLWWRDHHHGAPLAAVTHDAALVGWSGRF